MKIYIPYSDDPPTVLRWKTEGLPNPTKNIIKLVQNDPTIQIISITKQMLIIRYQVPCTEIDIDLSEQSLKNLLETYPAFHLRYHDDTLWLEYTGE